MSLTSYRTAPPRGKGDCEEARFAFRKPGGDLLSHALRRSTIGAEDFHGRVRDGIGCRPLAMATRPSKRKAADSPRTSILRNQILVGFIYTHDGNAAEF